MHVIQCADYGGPYAGSFVPMLTSIAREAASRGNRNAVLLSDVAHEREWLSDLNGLADVRFIRGSGSRAAVVRPTMSAFQSALGGSAPAVIHTHFSTFDMPAALMRARRRRLAVFWHEHGPILADRRTRIRNSVRYLGLGPLVNSILCVSPELRDELRARHAPKRALRYFPNAVDTRIFYPIGEEERREARRSLELTPTARVLLHFGWSWHRKGGDLMVEATELLRDQSELLALTVLGAEPGSHPDLRAARRVRPVPPSNDVRRLYAAADVFLSCGRAEGAPLAVLEAMACGLPVVATDLPAQEQILSGLPGAAIVGAEAKAIAGGVRRLLSMDEGQRSEHRRLAVERIQSSFALDAWARRIVDLYEQALRS